MSLIEALVIVAILGLIVAVTGDAIRNTYRKWVTQGAATEVSAFLAEVPSRAVEAHTTLFVRLANRTLTLCRNQDGSGVIKTYTFPVYIALSRTNPAGVDCSWPTAASVPIMTCDPNGINNDVNTHRMVNAAQTLVVTHRDMASGELKPRIIYTVTVSPLWRGWVEQTVEQ